MIQPALRQIKLNADSAAPDHLQLARQLERLIRTGKLKEGQRLPPTSTLVTLWKMHISQIQRGMDILTQQGLLQRFPRRGTFVTLQAARPSVGILIFEDLLQENAHFSRMMAATLEDEIQNQGLNPRRYDALCHPESDREIRSRNNLEYDRRHQRFNGFILFSGLAMVEKFKYLEKEAPIVAFGANRTQMDVSTDDYDFAFEALSLLGRHGCRKIAYMNNTRQDSPQAMRTLEGFRAAAAQGADIHPQGFINAMRMDDSDSRTADRRGYDCTLEALKQWKRKRFFPDGIIIPDDITARGVAVAIQSVLRPEEAPPLLVTGTTEGIEHFYALPAFRYTRSTKEIVQKLMQRLSMKAAGNPVPAEPDLIRGKISDAYR